MKPGEREEIEKVAKEVCVWIPGNLHGIPAWEMRHLKCKRCEKIKQAILTQVEKARRQQIEIDAKNYKRLVKIFLGEDAEIEFSEKMAKGWDNLMKFLSEESATN